MKTEYKVMIAVGVLAIGGLALAQNLGSSDARTGTGVDPSQTTSQPQAATPGVSAQRDQDLNGNRNPDDTASPPMTPRPEGAIPDVSAQRDSELERGRNPQDNRSTRGEATDPAKMGPSAEGTPQSSVTEGASRSNRN